MGVKSHRCKGSLAAHAPIRYIKRSPYPFTADTEAWRLCHVHGDDEYYDCVHVTPIAVITYCPFCGQKLEE